MSAHFLYYEQPKKITEYLRGFACFCQTAWMLESRKLLQKKAKNHCKDELVGIQVDCEK